MRGPDSLYLDSFVFQPTFYLFNIEIPFRANFIRGASREEPIIDIPRPYLKFSGELVSVHFLRGKKLLEVILLLSWKRIKKKVTAITLRLLAVKFDLKLPS